MAIPGSNEMMRKKVEAIRAEAATRRRVAKKLAATDEKVLKEMDPATLTPELIRGELHRLINLSSMSPEAMDRARMMVAMPSPPPPIDLGCTIFPNLSTDYRGVVTTDKWQVVLVGAGGVGARLAPLLIKHLTNGDILHIIDGDLVEAKNLSRQHFIPADIGVPKAQVVAQRARATAPRDGIEVGFSPMMLDAVTLPDFASAICWHHPRSGLELFGERHRDHRRSTLLITAVDTLAARKAIKAAIIPSLTTVSADKVSNLIWIDCGNSFSSGQAMVMGVFTARGFFQKVVPGVTGDRRWNTGVGFIELWDSVLPGFLDRDDPPPAEGVDNCALRIDPQTVLANSWAALAAASIAIPIISLSGIRTVGVGFSVTGQAHTSVLSQHLGVGGTSVVKKLA